MAGHSRNNERDRFDNTYDQKQRALDFSGTVKVIHLNKKTLNCAGIWPERIHEPIFVFFSLYLAIHCTLAIVDITDHMSDMEYVIGSVEENMFNLMALVKICICRIKRKSLAELLKDIRTDFIPERYKNNDEKIAFLTYNNFSLKFVTITMISCIIAATMYYVVVLAANVEMVIANSSNGYRLPYKNKPLIEPTNVIIYIGLCLYQFLIVPIIVFGYVGTDCLLISLVLHVSGLFSALSCKVKHILENPSDRRRRIKRLILRHIRLIRLAECLENDFNILILQQLLGSTFHLCLLGYDALVCTAKGQEAKLVVFGVIASCVLSTLLAYCYIGECLINESMIFGESFYHCEWYNISTEEMKLMHICMMRSTKQTQLTVGKFFALSLSTFTDVVKTSMAYLSVLRTFL